MIKNYILAAALMSVPFAHAQESRAETQSIRCGALVFILTSLSASAPELGKAMSDTGMGYGMIFKATRSIRTGWVPTFAEFHARKEPVYVELKKSWELNSEVVVREAALCNTWFVGFAQRLSSFKGAETDAAMVEMAGEPPVRPSESEVDKWRLTVTSGFVAWGELGYMTPALARQKIKDSLP
jgi:hypothetical protein